ncbi:MAG: LuxR family transcriptional regulator, partial [Proteobacteria bacterium]
MPLLRISALVYSDPVFRRLDIVYPILSYKFAAPPEIDGAVMRSRLLETVFASPLVRTVFVQAPAGYGKTTLLQQIMSHQQRLGAALGWLTLDAGDNDPARFLAHIHAVIDRAFDKPLTANDETTVGGAPAETFSTVEEILVRLGELERPLALFIDEFQVVSNDVIMALMSRLLERLPAAATFYIGSRNLPELGLGRLQLRNSALILKADDLRFNRDETVSFFAGASDVPLREELIDDLFKRTEGWPAALQLARLAIRGGADKPIVDMLDFSSEPQFEEYLANNVLALQAPEIQDFLLKTSVLERVAPDLCDHLTGEKNAEHVLHQLEINGLFIRPLGPDRAWFRFHSLFSNYLRKQLRRRQPGATRKLHELAMAWFAAHDYPDDAIHHAVEAENYAVAADILESWSAQLIREGRLTTIERWLDVLPVEVVRNQPLLQMKVLWALLFLR